MTVDIRVGDCRELLRSMPAESVQCVVTSPPYWGLRSYTGGEGMIGLEPTFEEHLANLVKVFREVRRVLRADGTCWLNYGDAYANKASFRSSEVIRAEGFTDDRRFRDKPMDTTESGLKPKDLLMMPARVAIALQADGWWVRSEIIWHKPNPMPESAQDRPTSSHEKLYLLTKSARYFYDADAVRVECVSHTDGKGDVLGTLGAAYSDDRRRDFHRTRTRAEQAAIGANLRNVWSIPTHSYKEAHFATFPPRLVEPCILAGTSAKGCCSECAGPWARAGLARKPEVVGVALKELRSKLGISREELARRIGVGGNNIWDWELGGHVPTGDRWNRLRDALGLDITKEDFVERAEYLVQSKARRVQTEDKKVKASLGDEHSIKLPSTKPFEPTCKCGADTKPCVVLDPFSGAGTVGLVADRLNRNAILLELSPQYAEMARERIVSAAPLLADVRLMTNFTQLG